MAGLIFDIETNGFLDKLTKVHCVSWMEEGSGVVCSLGRDRVPEALAVLEAAPLLIGHNILKFDIPAIQKVYPAFKPKGQLRDTLTCSRLMWTDIRDDDFAFQRTHPDFPTKMIGRHSLKAWGYRLGVLKGELPNAEDEATFAEWSEELEAYCRQDVLVNAALWEKIKSKNYSERAIELEHEFQRYITDQENEGFPFDEKAAQEFYAELAAKRNKLAMELAQVFPNWVESVDFIPKRDNKAKGYVKDVPFKKTRTVVFNPNSGQHIAQRLVVQRGWQPQDFTETGLPTVDEDVLTELGKNWPECAQLAEMMELKKFIGMVGEGKEAWLKVVKNGRIYGKVITNGCVTGRCVHKHPNLGQIPRKGELGKRCRSFFTAIPEFKLVGCDAVGLEAGVLAHFLFPFDGGQYSKIFLEGDVHTYHQKRAELDSREKAKTFFYAFLFGAGDAKIGLIVGKGKKEGKRLRLLFLRNFPALRRLKDVVVATVQARGHLIGLDGRQLRIRAVYSGLNTLIQSAGAILMKQAVIILNRKLRELGYYQSGDARQIVMVHDEVVLLVREGKEQEVGEIARQSIREAGEFFGMRLPFSGESKIGQTWREVH